MSPDHRVKGGIKHDKRFMRGRDFLSRRSVKGLHGDLSEVVVFEVNVWSATPTQCGE